MSVITNNHKRYFLYGDEVPAKVLNEDYDYLEDSEKLDGFIHYRNMWFHISDFLVFGIGTDRVEKPVEIDGKLWDAYAGLTAFSRVLIRVYNGESYTIGLECT